MDHLVDFGSMPQNAIDVELCLRITPKNYDARSFGKSTHMLTHDLELRTRSTPHSIIKKRGVRRCVVFGHVMCNGRPQDRGS